MEPNLKEETLSSPQNQTSSICPVCHQPVLLQYYFCPNCGTRLNADPLLTDVGTQAWIYTFSIILPMLAFIFASKWPGVKYFKSTDPKAKQIGYIAWALLILSTIVTIWFSIVWTQEFVQSSMDSINLNTYLGGL